MIPDELLRTRLVPIEGDISDAMVTETIARMLYLQHESRHREITLVIDSPGGTLAAAYAIVDTIRLLEPAVHTICEFEAHGAAAVVQCWCARFPHSASIFEGVTCAA
jgi:ATP-dependent Clp protease protease subunit